MGKDILNKIYRMSLFSKEFSREEIFSQPAREIPWYTLIEIIHKSKSHEEMINEYQDI